MATNCQAAEAMQASVEARNCDRKTTMVWMNWSEAPQVVRLIAGTSMDHWREWFEHKVSVAQSRGDRAAHARDSRSATIRGHIRQAAGALRGITRVGWR